MPRAHIFQVVALCVAGQFGPFAQAQVDTGSITGVVTDSSGALVPDAQVTITETQTNVRFAVTTNGSGFFSTPSLHPGPYQLEVAKQGFQTQKQTGINLRVQDRLELNFSLALGATANGQRSAPGWVGGWAAQPAWAGSRAAQPAWAAGSWAPPWSARVGTDRAPR